VYVRATDGVLAFHELPEPSAEDVADVARRTAARLVRVLKKHGRELDPELSLVGVLADATGEQDSALASCYAAAAAGTDLFGARAGSPALRLVDPSLARPHEPVAIAYGVNVHAAVRVHGNDRAQLARLCRYLGRPAIAEERLTRTDDDRLRYELKRAWKDGTRAIILSPLDLCARVCALIPRPGFHMVRYYGCLSSHSSLRREVVPEPAAAVDNPLDADPDQLALGFEAFDARGARHNSGNRRPWAGLLRTRLAGRRQYLCALRGTHEMGRGRHRARRHPTSARRARRARPRAPTRWPPKSSTKLVPHTTRAAWVPVWVGRRRAARRGS
jgi:hypothetical protein